MLHMLCQTRIHPRLQTLCQTKQSLPRVLHHPSIHQFHLAIILNRKPIIRSIPIHSLHELILAALRLPVAVLEQKPQLPFTISRLKIRLAAQPIPLRHLVGLRGQYLRLTRPVVRGPCMAALDPEDVDIGLTFFLHNALGVADVQAAARCPFREVEFRGHTDGVGGLAGCDCGVGVASDVCCIWESLHQPWMALLLKLLLLFKPCSACAVSPLLQLASGAAGLVLARRRCTGSWRFCCLSNGGLPRQASSASSILSRAQPVFFREVTSPSYTILMPLTDTHQTPVS
jgi:hypothetical protein